MCRDTLIEPTVRAKKIGVAVFTALLSSKTAIFDNIFKRTDEGTDKLLSTCAFAQNKAGYTAQDAPSMRTFHLRK